VIDAPGVGVEARGQDEHVQLVQTAIPGHHAPGLDVVDALGHQLHVLLGQGGIEVAGHDQPLAHGLVVGRELAAQLGVLHRGEIVPAAFGDAPPPATGLDDGDGEHLEHLLVVETREPGQEGNAVLAPRLGRGVDVVSDRRDPLRRALEHGEVARHLGERRHHLHARGAVADHADPLAFELHAVIPGRGVELRSLELLEAVDLGVPPLVERAAGRDEDVDGGLLAATRLDRPAPLLVAGARDLRIERNVGQEAVLLGHVLEVGQDLGPRREAAAPVQVRLEAVGVEERGHVAGEAGRPATTPSRGSGSSRSRPV
jgi:hypothetical protein